MRQLFFSLLLSGLACLAQSSSPVLLSAGNVNPFPLSVAPGQVLTLFVETGTIVVPVTPSDVSAVFSMGGTNQPMPVLQVGQAIPQVLAVTVQVPFGITVSCAPCATAIVIAESIAVSVNGTATTNVMVQAFQDQVHFLTSCDVIMAGPSARLPVNGGLPCTPIVTHANGTTVSALAPATAGEELVAYATGLGQTNPALTTGQPPAASSPTLTTFNIDFNYRVNALATEPGTVDSGNATPVFTGATEGYVGLYQINFIVPPPPPSLTPCVDFAAVTTAGIAVQSNLTVSVGSPFSFDGAGICVRPTVGSDNTE